MKPEVDDLLHVTTVMMIFLVLRGTEPDAQPKTWQYHLLDLVGIVATYYVFQAAIWLFKSLIY